MFARHTAPSIRRQLLCKTPAITRSLATRDVLARSSKPTAAPPRLNIYRDIWPPLLTCSGIALVVYYGLELWRSNLDYKYRLIDMAAEVQALRAQVDTLRQENEEKSTASSSRIFGGRTKDKSEGKSKWFGLF